MLPSPFARTSRLPRLPGRVRQKIRDYSMMQWLDQRPHRSGPRFVVPHQAREHDSRRFDAQHELSSAQHNGVNAQDHPIRRPARNQPAQHMIRRCPRPEPQTEAPDPSDDDKPAQRRRRVLEDRSRPLLRRTPIRAGRRDLPRRSVIRGRDEIVGSIVLRHSNPAHRVSRHSSRLHTVQPPFAYTAPS